MQYRLTKTVAATARAIELDAVKSHLRIDWESDDMLLEGMIDTACAWLETSVGRSLVTTTWRLDIDCWPECPLELPQSPLIAVSNVKYLDEDGVLTTLDAANYYVSTDSFTPATLTFLTETALPTTQVRPNAVQVTYTAGYGATFASVPATAKHALLLLVGHWYENREVIVPGTVSKELEGSLASLLRTLKTGFVAGVGV